MNGPERSSKTGVQGSPAIAPVLSGAESCDPATVARLCEPIETGEADLVIGRPARAAAARPFDGALDAIERRVLPVAPPGSNAWPRAFARAALQRVGIETPGDDGASQATLALKFRHEGLRIREIEVPGPSPERAGLRRLQDTRGVLEAVWRYRRTVGGASCAAEYAEYFPHYPFKDAA